MNLLLLAVQHWPRKRQFLSFFIIFFWSIRLVEYKRNEIFSSKKKKWKFPFSRASKKKNWYWSALPEQGFFENIFNIFFFFFKEEKWGENFFHNPQRESEEVKIDRCDSSRTLNCHSVAWVLVVVAGRKEKNGIETERLRIEGSSPLSHFSFRSGWRRRRRPKGREKGYDRILIQTHPQRQKHGDSTLVGEKRGNLRNVQASVTMTTNNHHTTTSPPVHHPLEFESPGFCLQRFPYPLYSLLYQLTINRDTLHFRW